MKTILFFIFVTSILACAKAWNLVWEDNFDKGYIDSQNWGYDVGDGCPVCNWGNEEEEWYTDSSSNSYVKDGNLVIEAKKEDKNNKKYTSARLVTKGKAQWRYGKFEIRAKFPKGSGLWPAIWLHPVNNVHGVWPRSGEIDIVEMIGQQSNAVHTTAHFGDAYDNKGQKTKKVTLGQGSFADDFHTFELVWNENKLIWYVDGTYVQELNNGETSPFNYPFNSDDFYLVMNLAVGGHWPQSPKDDTEFPAKMEVDYVKVYKS